MSIHKCNLIFPLYFVVRRETGQFSMDEVKIFEFSFSCQIHKANNTTIREVYHEHSFPYIEEGQSKIKFDDSSEVQKQGNAYVLCRRFLQPFFKPLRSGKLSQLSCIFWYDRESVLHRYFEYVHTIGLKKDPKVVPSMVFWSVGAHKRHNSLCEIRSVNPKKRKTKPKHTRSFSCLPLRKPKARMIDCRSTLSISLGVLTEDVYHI